MNIESELNELNHKILELRELNIELYSGILDNEVECELIEKIENVLCDIELLENIIKNKQQI